jgi:hypothetical protein
MSLENPSAFEGNSILPMQSHRPIRRFDPGTLLNQCPLHRTKKHRNTHIHYALVYLTCKVTM